MCLLYYSYIIMLNVVFEISIIALLIFIFFETYLLSTRIIQKTMNRKTNIRVLISRFNLYLYIIMNQYQYIVSYGSNLSSLLSSVQMLFSAMKGLQHGAVDCV